MQLTQECAADNQKIMEGKYQGCEMTCPRDVTKMIGLGYSLLKRYFPDEKPKEKISQKKRTSNEVGADKAPVAKKEKKETTQKKKSKKSKKDADAEKQKPIHVSSVLSNGFVHKFATIVP